jgi:hypothetical protein
MLSKDMPEEAEKKSRRRKDRAILFFEDGCDTYLQVPRIKVALYL